MTNKSTEAALAIFMNRSDENYARLTYYCSIYRTNECVFSPQTAAINSRSDVLAAHY